MANGMIEKGFKIEGPDGMGYEATRDLHTGDTMQADDFAAYGGAPETVTGAFLTPWLAEGIEAELARTVAPT